MQLHRWLTEYGRDRRSAGSSLVGSNLDRVGSNVDILRQSSLWAPSQSLIAIAYIDEFEFERAKQLLLLLEGT